MPRLTAGVALRHPGTGVPVFLPAGTDVPDWATGRIGAHVLDAGPPPKTMTAPITSLGPAATSAPKPSPPSRSGAGSGRAKWADYATAHGVTVTGDMSRDDIVAACATAGVPTE